MRRVVLALFQFGNSEAPAHASIRYRCPSSLGRSGWPLDKVAGAVLGLLIQAGCGMDTAWQSVMNGGSPKSVTPVTVNRVRGAVGEVIASALPSNRPDATVDGWAKLKPVFHDDAAFITGAPRAVNSGMWTG